MTICLNLLTEIIVCFSKLLWHIIKENITYAIFLGIILSIIKFIFKPEYNKLKKYMKTKIQNIGYGLFKHPMNFIINKKNTPIILKPQTLSILNMNGEPKINILIDVYNNTLYKLRLENIALEIENIKFPVLQILDVEFYNCGYIKANFFNLDNNQFNKISKNFVYISATNPVDGNVQYIYVSNKQLEIKLTYDLKYNNKLKEQSIVKTFNSYIELRTDIILENQ